MRALDPLGYEKEALDHFQTLKVSEEWRADVQHARFCPDHVSHLIQEVDPMRSGYYSDLCSRFMIENTILKMEYAEVRVFSISDKVRLELVEDRQVFFFLFWQLWQWKLCFLSEPDHPVPPGPTVTGHTYQPVLQSAGAAPSSVRHVAVPRGYPLKIPLSYKDIVPSFLCVQIAEGKLQLDHFLWYDEKSPSSLQVLEADNNKIENLEGVYQLLKLEEVLLRNNSILACVNLLIHQTLWLNVSKIMHVLI